MKKYILKHINNTLSNKINLRLFGVRSSLIGFTPLNPPRAVRSYLMGSLFSRKTAFLFPEEGISLQDWLDRDEDLNNEQIYTKMGITKKITLRNEKIEYTVRKHRQAKRLKLAISCDGNLSVTLPWRMGFLSADDFIRKNAEWVLEKMKSMKKIGRNSLFARHDKVQYLKLKEHAREMVTRRLEKYSEIYGFSCKGVAIRNQKTRWGSCSSKGNLNFNYKILLLPQRHADYIIVHELCHLKEFNHGKRFWNLVGQTIPEYESIVAQLKVL